MHPGTLQRPVTLATLERRGLAPTLERGSHQLFIVSTLCIPTLMKLTIAFGY
jgi:hypothetical protein